MSTKSTLFYLTGNEEEHNLDIHIYNNFHEAEDVICVDLGCSCCNCSYRFIVNNHVGVKLIELLKNRK